jgi:hypothetical protein
MTDIEVVILCAVVGVISGVIGWKASARFHEGIFSEMLERLDVSEDQLKGMVKEMALEAGVELSPEEADTLDGDKIHIRIEQHNATLYAYRKDTEEFIGQGTDKDALLARLVQQFPTGARLIIDDADGAGHIKENPTA